ncbi:MAG: hypothetical protein WB523_10040 [Candidatus Sulfotelmatobacter sp.]
MDGAPSGYDAEAVGQPRTRESLPPDYHLRSVDKSIYLDTNLWNALCDQAVDQERLAASLASKRATLVLGTQCIYEIAKTFRSSTKKAADRGITLFSYLKRFIEIDTPCAKETMELLAAEMRALKWEVRSINQFLNANDYAKVRQEVNKLATGVFDGRADGFIEERIAFARATRSSQAGYLRLRADTKSTLKGVPPENLAQWLQGETMTPAGVALLAGHIQRQFPKAPPQEVAGWSVALLNAHPFRVAKGIVRADLYHNWRCAHRESNPSDLVDDIVHVLNAIYCDVYATGECGQSEYAGLLLTEGTKVAIYDGNEKLDQWLGALAETGRVHRHLRLARFPRFLVLHE